MGRLGKHKKEKHSYYKGNRPEGWVQTQVTCQQKVVFPLKIICLRNDFSILQVSTWDSLTQAAYKFIIESST